MADIESIKRVIGGLRASIADGAGKATDMGVIDSGLQRVENLLGGETHQEQRTDPDKRAAAAFFARKKRKEGNWKNPLNA